MEEVSSDLMRTGCKDAAEAAGFGDVATEGQGSTKKVGLLMRMEEYVLPLGECAC